MGLYWGSSFKCRNCGNSRYWNTDVSEVIPNFTWIVDNKPVIKCGRCGSLEIEGSDSFFCSVDMTASDNKNLWVPGNPDLLWVLPDYKERRLPRSYGGAASTVSFNNPARFEKFSELPNTYVGSYVIMFRCDPEQGIMLSISEDAEFAKRCADSCIQEFKNQYRTFIGDEWNIPDGYIKEFDFRSDENKNMAERKRRHKESSVAWFNCERVGYDIIIENLSWDRALKEYAGCYLIIQDEHWFKGNEKRGNVIAVFSPAEWELLYNTEDLEGNYTVWHCCI